MSHDQTLATAREPSEFGVSTPRGLTTTIGLWREHRTESRCTLIFFIYIVEGSKFDIILESCPIVFLADLVRFSPRFMKNNHEYNGKSFEDMEALYVYVIINLV